MRLAHQIAYLDVVSNGRLEIGGIFAVMRCKTCPQFVRDRNLGKYVEGIATFLGGYVADEPAFVQCNEHSSADEVENDLAICGIAKAMHTFGAEICPPY